ncbi:protein preY, mitochondrial [Gouania willdenowi]|uniref:Protein preY, mitochondrial n=1 Tax=Gouania willdenowi TaxID=441366 RepID=A0A8C5EEN1_GOUWI|nr:protein preY, mitochondrial [Gouania willdenowi]
MLLNRVWSRLLTHFGAGRYAGLSALTPTSSAASVPVRSFSDDTDGTQPPFDASLLDLLVCPLSKKTLRYEAKTNELINDDLGIAYPIVDGIPNMIPQDARLIQKAEDASNAPEK